jgi:signal transduction histidine kinase
VRGSQEIRELAETFNKMAADLQHAETLRTNLMADVSHELRTPLTVLEGNLRAALDKVVPLDEAEIANLYGQTRHLIRLVNDLRELSLAESGQLPLEKLPTDLKALAAETVQALEPLAVEKGVTLADEVPPLPEVSVDPFRIRQVLFNLLSNALRHTPQGGKITVKGETGSGVVVLSVQDSGEGLEPGQLPAVFDRFYRADKSRSRETGGTGLGLAIVKAIAEAHGGRAEATSAGKGQGSRFSITIPK